VVLAVLVVLAAVGIGLKWFLLQRHDTAEPNLVGAAHANARGIGQMEQFQFAAAVPEFEEAMKLAPDWTPAKINLAIALFNTQVPANLDRALKLLAEVLQKEPNDPHAQYCSGIILYHRNDLAGALKHFEEVTKLDPDDAHAWYFRAVCTPDSTVSAQARHILETARRRDPSLNAARYNLAYHGLTDAARKMELLNEAETLKSAGWETPAAIKYTEMGRYADVIGKVPAPAPELGAVPMFEPVKGLTVKLADGIAWAADDKLDDFGKAVRARFGGTVVLLDYNRDGKPDVLLLNAVARGGKVGDVLLRNDGNNTFTDVTAEVGLDKHPGSFGAAVGDFDNDCFPELVLAGSAGLRLVRNADGKRF
jgi:Flp pilus assembly protein TadD